MTNGTRRGEGSESRPGHSLPPGKARYSFYRRLGGPQGRSGQMRKISPPPGFDPRTVHRLASRYIDSVIPALRNPKACRKVPLDINHMYNILLQFVPPNIFCFGQYLKNYAQGGFKNLGLCSCRVCNFLIIFHHKKNDLSTRS